MDTMEKVVTLLSEQLGVDKDKITAGSDVVKDLGADSIDVVQLLMAMEDEFGVTVTEDDASNLKTVEDIVSLIDNRKRTTHFLRKISRSADSARVGAYDNQIRRVDILFLHIIYCIINYFLINIL